MFKFIFNIFNKPKALSIKEQFIQNIKGVTVKIQSGFVFEGELVQLTPQKVKIVSNTSIILIKDHPATCSFSLYKNLKNASSSGGSSTNYMIGGLHLNFIKRTVVKENKKEKYYYEFKIISDQLNILQYL